MKAGCQNHHGESAMKTLAQKFRGLVRATVFVAVLSTYPIAGWAQTVNAITYPTGGAVGYGRHDTVTGYGTVDPANQNNAKMRFGTLDGGGAFSPDPNSFGIGFPPNGGASSITVVDLGAAFGFPGQYVVWNASETPDADGWNPSPVLLSPPFMMGMIPDHLVEFKAGGAVMSGPFFVF